MNHNPTYEFAGLLLSLRSTRSLIIDIYAGKENITTKDVINREIEERHFDLRGESASREDRNRYVSNSLGQLSNARHRGRSNGLSHWKIDYLELGTGNKWVYCFYFESDQYKAMRDKKWCWKCNIGRTGNDPFNRIRDQTRGDPKAPVIPLLIRTDDERTLELHIHSILKTRGRHLTNTNTNEDFLTCPSEIARIFFDSSYFSGEKIAL